MSWERVQLAQGRLPTPRSMLGCQVAGGKLYFFGGFGPVASAPVDSDDDDEGEAEDAVNFTWCVFANGLPRHGETKTPLIVLVHRYNDLFCFDPGLLYSISLL